MTDSAGVLEGWLLPRRGAAGRGDAANRTDAATGARERTNRGLGDERAAGLEKRVDERADRSDEISKKELLELTGLSYGQLYRWKRMGLIPEHWFLHRATFTGQETFFPRRLILERIETIQRLKDRYSLEEIAELLSPASSGRRYSAEEVERFNLCPPQGLTVLTAIYQAAGRPKRGLRPELQALLAPVSTPASPPAAPTSSPTGPEQAFQSSGPSTSSAADATPLPERASRSASHSPASYSFIDLVAGRVAVELHERGLSQSAVQGAIETLLAGASRYSTLDDVHVVCAEITEPRAEFTLLYSGLEPVVFGHGVTVTAEVAVGPIAESLRQSLQAHIERSP